MRKLVLITTSVLLLGLVAFLWAYPRDNRTQWDSEHIQSFVTYYGNQLEGLTNTDVAIVDTRKFAVKAKDKKELVKKLQDQGVYVITYVSVGEDVDTYNPEAEMKSYYYDKDQDGKPDRNPFWNSIFINANDKKWHAEVLSRIEHDAVDLGVDGIFMDTIDTVGVYPETMEGMVRLIRTIKDKYPALKLVANRGFDILEDMAPSIDGLMFEGFTASWNADGSYSELAEQDMRFAAKSAKMLNDIRETYPIPVFVLDYAAEDDAALIQQSYDRAWEHGFVPSVANKMLDQIYTHTTKPRTQWGAKIGHEMDRYGDQPDPIVDPTNVALASSKAVIKVDSSFPHYSPESLNDGYRHETSLTWDELAWASNTTEKNHWVEIQFSSKQKLDRIDIYWALDNGKFYTSQEYEIRYKTTSGEWVTFTKVTESESEKQSSSIPINGNIETDTLQVFQDLNKGPVNYTVSPNIMWISEIEVYISP